MRILLMANATVGLKVAEYLKARGETIVGLGLHEEKLRREGDAIQAAVGLPEDRVFLGNQLRSSDMLAKIESWKPDIAISAFWTYIFKEPFLKLFKHGTINFHPGYLPFCRGKNPNVWPIVEKTPGGVTLHYVDPGIDTGDIIARRQIPVDATDTGGTYYDKTLDEIVKLFVETWPQIREGRISPLKQSELKEKGTHHYAVDVDKIDEIKLDKTYTGEELLNILRARTYGEKSFAYFRDGTDKIYVSVKLKREKGAP